VEFGFGFIVKVVLNSVKTYIQLINLKPGIFTDKRPFDLPSESDTVNIRFLYLKKY